MLRPQACQWFELITARDDLVPTMEALARSGAVELQAHESHEARGRPLTIPGDEHILARYHELARAFHGHWPAPSLAASTRIADPAATLAARVAQLEAWRAHAEPLLAERERLAAQRQSLLDLGRLLAAAPQLLPAPGLLASAGRFVVDARLYAVAARRSAVAATALPAEVMQWSLPVGDEEFVILVGARSDMPRIDEHFALRKARRIAWPIGLDLAAHGGSAQDAAHEVARALAAQQHRQREIEDALAALQAQHDVAAALADIAWIEWLMRQGSELSASERLVWVTGWTTARDEATFCAELDRSGLRCVVQFCAPPAGAQAPSMLSNPPWARAFEAFARLLGQPGRDEADPSPIVALIAPLLFGFMFGDVGQGAVLCIAGWWLRKRVPMLVLLVPGGAMAMVFGLLFGEVFAREDLIAAWWLRPLHEPITLLLAAIGLGAAILLGGLVLNAVQAQWRGETRLWWARDAGLMLAYLSLLGAPFEPALLWLALAGGLWFTFGSMLGAIGGRLPALGRGLAQCVEQLLQLLVNTVSFARVGAFALAHAGLSMAVIGVAEASGAIGYWIVLVLGNVLIIALEGLVVGIQTTRLLLFEFFVRFLKGSGRAFKPLSPPHLQPAPTSGSSP
jgi:V/A-type H+/Na+-transporting ATPase subunit I